MDKILLKSIWVDYEGQKIITDIDDCLIHTSESIINHRIRNSDFWFKPEIYERNKKKVFMGAELTRWGKEFVELVKDGTIKEWELITAAKARREILTTPFSLSTCKAT